MSRIQPNEGKIDRIIRAVLGFAVIFLALSFLVTQPVISGILIIIGIVLLVTALAGFCPLYKILGINTGKKI